MHLYNIFLGIAGLFYFASIFFSKEYRFPIVSAGLFFNSVALGLILSS